MNLFQLVARFVVRLHVGVLDRLEDRDARLRRNDDRIAPAQRAVPEVRVLSADRYARVSGDELERTVRAAADHARPPSAAVVGEPVDEGDVIARQVSLLGWG